MARVLVCGGRDQDDYVWVKVALDGILEEMPIDLILHGNAPGADALADNWACGNGIDRVIFPATWALGRKAGPLRNQRMIDIGKPDLCVALPGGKGTADMVRRCKKAGIEVREF